MARETRKHARSGGSLLALSLIAGAIGGVVARQPSIGILAGFGIGMVLLLAVWLLDRRRGL
jgi:hypothetical protein